MQIMPELYQPNDHVCVRLPLVSTKVSSCQYIQSIDQMVLAVTLPVADILIDE